MGRRSVRHRVSVDAAFSAGLIRAARILWIDPGRMLRDE
jgi:hypothetical protein